MDSRALLLAQRSRIVVAAYIAVSELLILWICRVSANSIVSALESDSDYRDVAFLRTPVVLLATAIGVHASVVFDIYRSTAYGIAATAACCTIAVIDSLCVARVFPVANELVSLFIWPITSVVMGTLFLHPAKTTRIASLCLTCLILLGLLAGVLSIVDNLVFESLPLTRLGLRIGIVLSRFMELSLVWNGTILFFALAKVTSVDSGQKVAQNSGRG